MNDRGERIPRLSAPVFALLAGLCAAMPSMAQTEPRCTLPSEHAGFIIPLERVEPGWVCRLQPIVMHYTTANKIGPIRTPLPETAYRYLLDHPPMAAALINRLDLGLYRAEARGPVRYWGHDGEGTEGIVELAYEDRTTRIYYLEGSHDSRLLPQLTGKAVVIVNMNRTTEADGTESMETTMVSYTRLDNRVLSGILSLLRPLIGGMVTHKLAKGVETVNQLSRLLRQQPDRVLFEATDPPALADEEVAFLKQAVAAMRHPSSLERKSPDS